MMGRPSSEKRKRRKARSPLTSSTRRSSLSRVVHQHLEVAAIASRHGLQRKLVRDKLADLCAFRARNKPASDKDGYDVRITMGPLPANTRAAFMIFLVSVRSRARPHLSPAINRGR
jgi:hypothetical protein